MNDIKVLVESLSLLELKELYKKKYKQYKETKSEDINLREKLVNELFKISEEIDKN
jgi:hypothetical protein